MSKNRFSTVAVVRVTDLMGRTEVVRSTNAGTVVRTEYPAHPEHGYLHAYNEDGTCHQVWVSARLRGSIDACRPVDVRGGDRFPGWLAEWVGGSLVTEAADWDRAVAGVRARADRIWEERRPQREAEERMREEEQRLRDESDAREEAMGWGHYEDAYAD
ncbi:hypothetical protein [Lichenibacterium dinghuense]|uniref:hypothetical protein n=1 Tax=Lichenibacterium dinghuense TaxID=2895977 RepID=UPI001F43393E|nr:hypothetical protein [Lichenibacterium sp. 6Y81]